MIFIPMKYHSIYFDDRPKDSIEITCIKCGRTFYIPKDIVDSILKISLTKNDKPAYYCETCAAELEKDGKIKITKKESSSDISTDILEDFKYDFADLSDLFKDISSTFDEMSTFIKEALG